MDEDCNNMLDSYLTNETTTNFFDSVPWPEEYILSSNNNKMADDNDERDIHVQGLFDGVSNPEVDQDDDNVCLVSWGEGPSSRVAEM